MDKIQTQTHTQIALLVGAVLLIFLIWYFYSTKNQENFNPVTCPANCVPASTSGKGTETSGTVTSGTETSGTVTSGTETSGIKTEVKLPNAIYVGEKRLIVSPNESPVKYGPKWTLVGSMPVYGPFDYAIGTSSLPVEAGYQRVYRIHTTYTDSLETGGYSELEFCFCNWPQPAGQCPALLDESCPSGVKKLVLKLPNTWGNPGEGFARDWYSPWIHTDEVDAQHARLRIRAVQLGTTGTASGTLYGLRIEVWDLPLSASNTAGTSGALTWRLAMEDPKTWTGYVLGINPARQPILTSPNDPGVLDVQLLSDGQLKFFHHGQELFMHAGTLANHDIPTFTSNPAGSNVVYWVKNYISLDPTKISSYVLSCEQPPTQLPTSPPPSSSAPNNVWFWQFIPSGPSIHNQQWKLV
ncbi:MAG: hypothetical protein ACYCOU_00735 [Sulfobacillus sp.]